MKNKFSSFLTQKGRWLTAILFLLTFSIGQMWGGVTFSAQDFLDAKHDNTEHATCSAASGLTLKTGDAQLDYYSSNKLDGIQISSSTTNQVSKASSYVEVKADKGYAVSSIEFKSVVANNSDAAIAVVGWVAGINSTSCDYFATPNFPKKNNTSAPSNTTISFEGNYQTVRLYRQILINNSDKTFASSSSDATKKGAGKSINLFEATVTTKIAPVIEGDEEMLKSETITLTGYPSGGTWAIESGTAATINATTGALTSGASSGDVQVSYTVSGKKVTHDVSVLNTDTKTLCWNFTKGEMPTACGITAQGNGAFNEYGYNLAEADVNFAYVDVTSAGYEITVANLTIFPGGTGDKTVKGDFKASLSEATSDGWQILKSVSTKNVETDYGAIPDIPTGCRVIRITKGNTGCAVGTLCLTVKKYVAPATYTVTLNPADGTIASVPSGWTLTAGQYIKSGITSGSSVDLLALTKEGYKLNGWKDGENADYTSPVTVTSDLTLTAQWAQTYAVTYVPNNGVLPAETMTDNNAPYKAGDEVTLLTNTFTAPDGKEFDEWVVTETVSGDPVAVSEGKFTMPAAAVTVTATWKSACALAPTVSATTLGTTSYTTQVVNCAGISVLGSAGCTISEYGFVYGTATAPTISDNKKALEGDYTVAGTAFPATTITGLAVNTKYYVRAYATNSFGTAYGEEVNFTTLAALGNVLVVASSASQTSDAITALRDNGFVVTVSAHDNSRSYTGYDLVVLDESLGGSDAQTTTNEESKIKDVNIPILNLKAFFYTKTNRWNWGTPVNGTSGNEVANISEAYCNAQSHPIFEGLTINEGAIDLIDPAKSGNTLQGVTTNTLVEGKVGYTLATSGTGITFIHELTPSQRGVDAKYLMIAISNNAKDNLSDDAKKLIVNAAKYLIGSTAWEPVEGLGTTTIDATGNPFSEGATMTLTASATGATASTTYAWYKGDTWAEAEAAGTIQAAKTAENSGHIYTKTAASEDAGTYWCVMVKSTGCEATASVEVSVLSCTKPGTPANLAASDLAYTTADLSWDAADNSDGYKISIIKKDDESVIVDWTDNATTSYAATGLTQGTEYTFKVKAKGATGYCEFGLEATVDFTTTAPSVADLVTIADDYTFTPSATIAAGTLAEDNKLFASGANDCDYNGSGMRIKENRALAFNVNNGAKVKVTFGTNGDREMKLGTAMTGDDSKVYGHSKTSPVTFDVTADGVVYLTSTSDLRFTKMEIMYPHTVTYDLNGGTGDPVPTQASKYVGETFTAHDGVTGITAPSGQEFDKWKDQDNADVAASATYTMPAKNVILTAQWRAETVKYTVTYDLDDYTAGVAPTETNKAAGDVFAIKAAPSRDGYAFMGWLCNIDAQTYQATDDYTMTAAPTTFTAVWKQEFQVSFNLQGYGTPIAPQIIVDGGKVVKPADPEEMLYEFGGWYKEAACTNAWDFANDVVEDDVELFAKWTAFDGCVYLAPVALGDALAVGDNVNLKTGSFGGTVKVAGLSGAGKIAYNAAGLAFTGGGGDSIRVTLTEKMMAGTKITVRLQSGGESARGLKLQTLAKSNVTTLGWSSATTNGAVASFTYTVVADDGLDGKKAFLLSRNNTVYLKYISVENCAPEEFVVTYMDGETEMGTENVYSGNHPTAAGITTHKAGYAFEGWKETVDGAVKALNTITITADKTLYAEYSARDCSGNGVMFSQVAKANTLESDYSLSGTTEVSIGEYATVTGGEVYLNNNNGSTRVKITKTTSVIQLTGGDDGYIHVLLDCPLKTGDTIKADNTNKWVIAHNASKTDKVQLASGVHYFVVTDGWNNKGEFYIWRDGSSCNISTIKVIRPAKYTVSFNMKGHGSAIADIENVLEGSKISAPSPAPTDEDYAFSGWYKENTLENEWDFANDVVTDDTELFAKWLDKSDATLKSLKYGDTDINLTTAVLDEGVYVFAVNVSPLATGVPALTAETSNPNASAAITNATEFDGERHATSTVVVTPEKSGAATKTYKVNFTKLQLYTELVDVTETTNWDWDGVATAEVKINDVAVRGLILANYIDAPNFEKLEGQENARAYRSTTYQAYQGTYLRFHATKPGKLTINARNSSGSPKLYVNGGDPVATLTSTRTDYTVIVPAGDVIITSTDGEIRIYNMTYKLLEELTPDYERTTTEGRYGTICLPKAGVMVGASIFEIAYFDVSSSKIFFDEIVNGVMEAGVPYIFLPNNGVSALGVYYTDDASAPAGNRNGLYGSYTEEVLDTDGSNYILLNNQYCRVVNSNTRVGANRAYIKLAQVPDYPTSAPLPGRRRVSMGVQGAKTPTGLENGELLNGENGVQKVLINGELFILRGEKMYDATGRLVK